jgi:hypothetical protein
MISRTLAYLAAVIVFGSCIAGHAATFRRLGSISGGPFYVSPDGSTFANLSADGNVVTGQTSYNPFNGGQVGFRWTPDAGMKWLEKPDGLFGITYDFTSFPRDISADGSVIVGQIWTRSGSVEQFRWTAQSGMTAFPSASSMQLVSPNGQYMTSDLKVFDSAGTLIESLPSNLNDGSPFTESSAQLAKIIASGGTTFFCGVVDRWDPAAGAMGEQFLCRWRLGQPPEKLPNSARSRDVAMSVADVSPDGSVMLIYDHDAEVCQLWTEDAGFRKLEGLIGATSVAGMSPDGTTIVFNTSNAAHIWDENQGARPLQALLTQEYGLGGQLAGWSLNRVQDISDDGAVISGQGINPEGQREYWVVNLRGIPEPTTAALSMMLSITLVGLGRRFWRGTRRP